jgi:hypothetical protein
MVGTGVRNTSVLLVKIAKAVTKVVTVAVLAVCGRSLYCRSVA